MEKGIRMLQVNTKVNMQKHSQPGTGIPLIYGLKSLRVSSTRTVDLIGGLERKKKNTTNDKHCVSHLNFQVQGSERC